MLSAIGSSAYSGFVGSGPSAAGLQAQLDRYQKQLSDCVNCSSANTLEGRKAIQDLSGQISEVKARIEQITSTKSNAQPAAPSARISTDIAANKDALASGLQDNIVVVAASASGLATATVGSILNVFA